MFFEEIVLLIYFNNSDICTTFINKRTEKIE